MPKDTFWFEHDYEPTSDPKMQALIGEYKAEGYGVYWRIVEMLHSDGNHKLPLKKYIFLAIAKQMQANVEHVENLIRDCINVFELFISDGNMFWSGRVDRNIDKMKGISNVRSEAGKNGAFVKQMQANAKQKVAENNTIHNSTVYTEDIGEYKQKIFFEIHGLGKIEIILFTNTDERWKIRELFYFITKSQKEFEIVAMSKPFMNNCENFQFALQEFVKGLQEKGDYKEKGELNRHFINWLNTQNGSLENLKKSTTPKGQPKIKLG